MSQPPEQAPPNPPGFGRSMGTFWLYTLGRFAIFGILFLILWLVGLGGFLGAIIALVLSVPISYFALARPRAMFAQTIEQRVDAQRVRHQDRSRRLSDGDD